MQEINSRKFSSPALILTFTANLWAWVLQEYEESLTLHRERNLGFVST